MSHSRKFYTLVQAVACMGGLALPGVASAANFTFIAVFNQRPGDPAHKAHQQHPRNGTADPDWENKVALLFD